MTKIIKKTKSRSLIPVLICVVIFSSCSSDKLSNGQSLQNNEQTSSDKSEVAITVDTPIVFSKNKIEIAGNSFWVNVEMVKGSYFYDEMPGPNHGNNWVGDYQIRVYKDEYDLETFSDCEPITIIEDEKMLFANEFSLVFDDYNNDGYPEFTLGQYGSSNSFLYALFSIDSKGEILKIDTNGYIDINQNEYSIQLDKTSADSFRATSYNNSIAEYENIIYEWHTDQFVPNREE